MAWVRVAIVEEEFSVGKFDRATGRRVYRCQADDVVGTTEALTAEVDGVAVAVRGDAFDDDNPGCVAVDVKAKYVSSKVKDVEVEYDGLGGFEATSENLLAKPAEIELDYDDEDEEYTRDVDDKWVASSSAEPFDKNPTRIRQGRVFTIAKYVNAATIAILDAAQETINAADVTILGRTVTAKKGLLLLVKFKPSGVSGVEQAIFKVVNRKREWTDKVVDQGYRQNGGGSGEWEDITNLDTDGNEVPVAKPWPLDGSGNALEDPTTGLVNLTFKPYDQSAWTGVPLS